MAFSIEITMNRLVTDRWTIYCRRKPTDKEVCIRLEYKQPINGGEIMGSLQMMQKEKGSQFSQYSIFRCIPTAEEPPVVKKKAAKRKVARCRRLPRQWVYTFKMRFVPLVRTEAKLRTMRPERIDGKRPKPGDRISLRYWRGKAYWSKQDIIRESTVKAVSKVVIEQGKNPLVEGKRLTAAEALAFARYDGFEDYADMQEWFAHEHGKKHGKKVKLVMIEWEPMPKCRKCKAGIESNDQAAGRATALYCHRCTNNRHGM